MAEHNDIGFRGELIAITHLEKEGYILVAKNWRWKRDEIDIIVRKGTLLVFVEVKTRTNAYAGAPALSVTPAKQKRIIRAASEYLRDSETDDEVRFDIIGIITNSSGTTIDHIEEAFYPSV